MALNVYYLDDEVDLLDTFKDTFDSGEYAVTTFSDPAQFIAAVKSAPPDLIFLDYRMPGTSGDEVAKQIDRSIPRVFISGELDLKPVGPYIKMLLKPCKNDDIEAILTAHLKLKK